MPRADTAAAAPEPEADSPDDQGNVLSFRKAARLPRDSRYRERQRLGRVVLNIECHEVGLVELLIRAGLLDGWPDDRRDIERALERQLEVLVQVEL